MDRRVNLLGLGRRDGVLTKQAVEVVLFWLGIARSDILSGHVQEIL